MLNRPMLETHAVTRQTVRVHVTDGNHISSLIGDGPIAKAIEMLQELAAMVPQGQIGELEIDRDGLWELSYHRPETDEEMTQRILREQGSRAATERYERRLLAELKAKYER